MDRLRVLTWHVHGAYLEALAWAGVTLFVPVRPGRPARYGGAPTRPDLPSTIVEVPADGVRDLDLDVVLCQARDNWLSDRFEILSEEQLRLPHVYVEHDPPREHPTDTRHHVADEPDVLLVHVTAFNALMWDSGTTPVRVIEHGVPVRPGVAYGGELDRGIVVINDLATRGRRLGRDIFEAAREQVPLDLIGLRAPLLGGLEPVPHEELGAVMARYRLYFHPIRYTSFGMAACEAMLIGLPVVALATTEMPTVIEDGVNGFASTDPAVLVERMRELLADPGLAREIGRAGQVSARERFSVERFGRDWNRVLHEAAGRNVAQPAQTIGSA
ncbi:MAG TPA: glycosyltransferase family 4 protein, partial [Candidatus Limnocylindrales bacterium]